MKIIDLINTAIKFLSKIFEWIKFKQRVDEIARQRDENTAIDKEIDKNIQAGDIKALNDQLGFKVAASLSTAKKATTKKATNKKATTKKATTKK